MLRQERKPNLKKEISLHVDNINIHSHNHIIQLNNKSRNICTHISCRRNNMEDRACAVFVFKMFRKFYGGCWQREVYRCDFSRLMQEAKNALSVT